MAENKAPSFFHLYLDYDEQFRMLSDAQAGMLIKALFSYANDGEEPDFDDLTVKLFFSILKKSMDREFENYQKICEQNRKNIKAQKMEEAAKQVSNNKAENEMKISNILNSINFTESLLPVEKLDYKSNDSQPYGDLEFAVVVASDLISSNTYDYSGVDISNIDASIVVIAQELKNAIETGDVNRAFSAKAGLVVAINDVRNKIPFVPEDMKKAFVESCESYLDLWKTLIMSCTSLDALQKNLDSQIANIEKKKKKYSEDNKAVAKRLIEEPELQQKIESISNETFISNGQRWDQESLDFYKFLVNQRIEKSALTFELLQHDMLEKQMAYQSKIINDYRTRVENNPVPEDPNLLNKYKDMMEQEFKRAAEIDAQFDELGEYMDSMDERINQMAYSKGSIRQKRIRGQEADACRLSSVDLKVCDSFRVCRFVIFLAIHNDWQL